MAGHAASRTPKPSIDRPSRWLALFVLCAGLLMIILDGTVVTVALPSIQRDLGFSATQLSWVVGAYLIPFGGLLLLAGRLGDLTGRRRIFIVGVLAFTVASALCGLATSAPMLILARLVQGAAGAVASAVVLAMVVGLFEDARERSRAIGIYSFVGAAGAAIGLLIGGLLTETFSWHWVFLINVPIGIATAAMAWRTLPANRPTAGQTRRDVLGALLITSGLMLAVFTITESPRRGWASVFTIGLGAVSLLLVIAFIVRESRISQPLLPMTIFADRRVWVANVAQFLAVGALFAFQFLLALYLQDVLGYGAAAAGVAFLPITVMIGVFSLLIAPRVIVRWGGRAVLVTGLTLIGIGLALLSRVPVDGQYFLNIFPVVMIMGAGGGLTLPALAGLGMAAATNDDSGVASGLLNTTQQVGGALGLAVLSSLAAARSAVELADGAEPSAALTAGYRLAFAVGTGLIVLAVLITVVALREPDQPAVAATMEPHRR